jgi:hypothetical protein
VDEESRYSISALAYLSMRTDGADGAERRLRQRVLVLDVWVLDRGLLTAGQPVQDDR